MSKEQFKRAYGQIRAGKKIEDFWGEDVPYSILRAASEATGKIAVVSLDTRLTNFKLGKLFFK